MSRKGKGARAKAATSHHNAQISSSGRVDAARHLKETRQAIKQISLEFSLQISLEFSLPPMCNEMHIDIISAIAPQCCLPCC